MADVTDDRTAQYAIDTMVAVEQNETRWGLEMIALLEAVDFDYARFCDATDLDPADPESDTAWAQLHAAWAKLATQLGWERFDRVMGHRVEKWRRLTKKPRSQV